MRDALYKGDRDHALIIDGQSLAYAMLEHELPMQELCELVTTVLCCRMTPIQKAQVPMPHLDSLNRSLVNTVGFSVFVVVAVICTLVD